MHEIGLCEGIVETARRRAGKRPVAAIRVRIGALHRVDQPSMQQAFSLVTMGTVLEHAALAVEIIPVTLRCRACDEQTLANEVLPACPACGGLGIDVSGGDDLMLESLEYQVVAAAVPPTI